jgi:uncharacterized membrane protein YfhO
MESAPKVLTQVNKKTILFLLIAAGAVCVAAFYPYIFGNRYLAFRDVGNDTLQQYLSQYASVIGKLRRGDFSLWDANNGFGVNLFLYNLTNPVLMVLYLIGFLFGNEALLPCLVYVLIGEIMGSAVCAYLYLSVFHLDEKAKAAASFMYAFNGFLIVWGQHYQFGAICLILPLLLWTIERRIRDPRRWPALTVMTCICALDSMYLSYMSLIICAVYVMVRCLMRNGKFVSWFRSVLACAWPMVLGLMMGFINLWPSYQAIRVSSRLYSSYSLIGRLLYFGSFYATSYYKTLFMRLFSSASQGITAFGGYLNYYESPQLFFSMLFGILFLQYLFLIPSMKTSRKNKVIHYAVAAASAAGLLFMEPGILMNGGTAPFSRYTFLYMPYFLLVSGFTLHRIVTERKMNPAALAVSALLIFVFYRTAILGDYSNSKKGILLLSASGVLMCAALLFFRYAKAEKVRRFMLIVLAAGLAVNVWSDTYMSFFSRNTINKTGDRYTESMYSSDIEQALEYLKMTDTQYYRIEKTFGATSCMDSLVQDYHPVSTYNSTMNSFTRAYVDTYWSSLSYHDQNHLNFSLGSRDTDQAQLVGIKYIIAKRDNQNLPGYEPYAHFGDYTVFKSTSVKNIASFYDEGDYSEIDVGAEVEYEKRDTDAEIEISDTGKSDFVSASVNVPKDGLLFTAIPYELGWTVEVDGQETPAVLTEKGFLGVQLKAGSHTVTYRYSCPCFKKGALISFTGAAVFVLLLTMGRIRRKKIERNAAL